MLFRSVSDGKNQFRIYDIEKTVVDIIFYRDKVGIEETKEILVNYLERKERHLNRLVRYAETMKCPKFTEICGTIITSFFMLYFDKIRQFFVLPNYI